MNMEYYYGNADVIFTATVKEKFETCSMLIEGDSNISCGGGAAISRAEIEEIYKDSYGSLERSRTIGVLVATGGSAEDIPAIAGTTYLMFGKFLVGEIIAVPACQGSSSFPYANEIIPKLQKIKDAFGENSP